MSDHLRRDCVAERIAKGKAEANGLSFGANDVRFRAAELASQNFLAAALKLKSQKPNRTPPVADKGVALLEAPSFGASVPHVASRRIWLWQHLSDYAPLYRSRVGFDRVFNLLENAQRARSISDWPPYDIVKTGDDSYRISIAVAGLAQDNLDITFQSNLLSVIGKKQETSVDGYLIGASPAVHSSTGSSLPTMSGSTERV